jgi:HEXXH motif-containing protein
MSTVQNSPAPPVPMIPFLPVDVEHDHLVAAYRAHRRAGLGAFGNLLGQRIDPEVASAHRRAEAVLDEISEAEPSVWDAIVAHPLYGNWWTALSHRLRDKDFSGAAVLLPDLARFVTGHALRTDVGRRSLASRPLRVSVDRRGEIRFPGSPRHIRVPALAGAAVEVMVNGNVLRLAAPGATIDVPLDELTGTLPPRPGSVVFEQLRLRGTAIEVDASDAATEDFFRYLNETEPLPPGQPGQLRAATVSADVLDELLADLDQLASAWPEMRTEVEQYVRLLVPIADPARKAFSNTSWQGAVFLRADFDDPVHNVERIVHETSHLRLNLVMDRVRLHNHPPADTVSSPFRPGPRPVDGLYHGAFVFTRVAMAMDRIAVAGGDPGFAERVPHLLSQVRQAFAIIAQSVRLTGEGRRLLAEVEAVATEIGTRYPDLPEADPLDPYLDF